MPAKLSAHAFWLLPGWLLVLFVIYLSLTPEPVQIPVTEGDKFGHVFAYAALMSWFANLYETSRARLQLAAGFIALGVGLEFVQRWSGYRTFDIADMASDSVGVAVGWVCSSPRIPNYLRLLEKIFRRR